MQERCEEMGVVDSDGDINQNVLVPEAAFLQTAIVSLYATHQRGFVHTSQS